MVSQVRYNMVTQQDSEFTSSAGHNKSTNICEIIPSDGGLIIA